MDTVSGCFTCFSMRALLKAGMYDENVFLYNEENIISKRLKNIGYEIYRLNNCSYIHDHKRKRGVHEANYKKIFQSFNSGYYYQVNYNNIKGIKKALFWIFMHIGIVELYVINFLKKIGKRGDVT